MRTLLTSILVIYSTYTIPWGFHAHKEINFHACFTLPKEMFGFYKSNINSIRNLAIRPDQRRYVSEEEAPRHYIDIDQYELKAPLDTIPFIWDNAVEKYGEHHLLKHGIVPWHILKVKYYLSKAMRQHDYDKIIRLSADIGHYIADAHVPLHTTKNYDGQLTGQRGIHGLWESRLPEVFSSGYHFFTDKATYLKRPLLEIWRAVEASFQAKDSVLYFERKLSHEMPNTKYSFERRGGITRKVYSREFSEKYHLLLNSMVERRMKKAIHMVGSFWYTAWIDAGQPELPNQKTYELKPIEQSDTISQWYHAKIKGRMETH